MNQTYTLHKFDFSGMDLTCVVTSPEDFSSLIQTLRDNQKGRVTVINTETRISEDDINRLAEARHIPMVCRGTATESIFSRYGVETRYMSVVVRGEAFQQFLMQMPQVPQSQLY